MPAIPRDPNVLALAFLQTHSDPTVVADLHAFLREHAPGHNWGEPALAAKVRAIRQRIFDMDPHRKFSDIPKGETFIIPATDNGVAKQIKSLPCVPDQSPTEAIKQRVRAFIEALPADEKEPFQLPHSGELATALFTSTKTTNAAMEELEKQGYVRRTGEIYLKDSTKAGTWIVAPGAPRRTPNDAQLELNGLDPITHQLAEKIDKGDLGHNSQDLLKEELERVFSDEKGTARSQAVCLQLVALGRLTKDNNGTFVLSGQTTRQGLTKTQYREILAAFRNSQEATTETPPHQLLATAFLAVVQDMPPGARIQQPRTVYVGLKEASAALGRDERPPSQPVIKDAYDELIQNGSIEVFTTADGKTAYQVTQQPPDLPASRPKRQ